MIKPSHPHHRRGRTRESRKREVANGEAADAGGTPGEGGEVANAGGTPGEGREVANAGGADAAGPGTPGRARYTLAMNERTRSIILAALSAW